MRRREAEGSAGSKSHSCPPSLLSCLCHVRHPATRWRVLDRKWGGKKGDSFNHFLDLCPVYLLSSPQPSFPSSSSSPPFPSLLFSTLSRPTSLYGSQSLISPRRRCQKSGRESHSPARSLLSRNNYDYPRPSLPRRPRRPLLNE